MIAIAISDQIFPFFLKQLHHIFADWHSQNSGFILIFTDWLTVKVRTAEKQPNKKNTLAVQEKKSNDFSDNKSRRRNI